MGNGKIIRRQLMEVKNPLSSCPRYFGYIHAVADSPDYYSKGLLRRAENHCIFHYTLRGRGVCYDVRGNHTVEAGEGFLSVIHDPLSGYSYPQDGTEEWEFICFCFDGGNAVDLVGDLIRSCGTVYCLPPDSPVLSSLTEAVLQGGKVPYSPFESSRYFYELYTTLVEIVNATTESGAEAFHPNVQAARRLIREEVEENLTIEQISFRLGLSREYLSRLYKSETGRLLKDHIREERILRACRLLKGTELSVAEIARRMNFSSDANFARYFHQTMHITPSMFRKVGTIPDFLTVRGDTSDRTKNEEKKQINRKTL